MLPLPKDYHRAVSEMETNDLLRSTLTDDSRTQKGDQVNLMGDTPASEMEWNEPFFRDCFDNVTKVVTWISRKGKSFARHQTIAQGFITENKKKIDCGAVILKSVMFNSMRRRGLFAKQIVTTFTMT
jgi:hypothetical protein